MQTDQSTNELMTAVSFNKDDLAANKLGRLTVRQKRRIEREFENAAILGKKIVITLWLAVLILLIALIIVGAPASLFSRGTKPAMPGDSLKWAIIGFFLVSLVSAIFSQAFILLARKGANNSKLDLPVRNVKGTVEKPFSEYGYTLRIDDREFVFGDANDPVYEAFETGKNYSVYYVFNTSQIIVSAEHLELEI